MFSRELFLLAVSFYTRIRISTPLDYQKLAQAVIYLPLIGWIVGIVSGATFFIAQLFLSQISAILLASAAGIFLTGAFHEDGLADVCDGFGGGYGKARILEIMKDPHIGVFGVLGLVLVFALKVTTLNEFSVNEIPFILLAGHSISRIAPLQIMFFYDYARLENSKTIAATKKLTWRELSFAAFFAFVPMLLLPLQSFLLVFVLIAATAFLGSYFFNKIGGYAGDCLGATQQICEIIFYICLSAIWKFI
jgi:adenosylcobinamide-GDP ribazoletransferase